MPTTKTEAKKKNGGLTLNEVLKNRATTARQRITTTNYFLIFQIVSIPVVKQFGSLSVGILENNMMVKCCTPNEILGNLHIPPRDA